MAHEDYFGVREEFANFSQGLQSVQPGKSDVEQDQVRVECFRLLNRC